MGIPQAIDPNTKDYVFGHYARIQVEVDLLHTLHPKLLIEREGYSFEVLVSYENVPKFCSHCHFIGHLVGECKTLKRIQELSNTSSLPKDHPPKRTSKKYAQVVVTDQKNTPQVVASLKDQIIQATVHTTTFIPPHTAPSGSLVAPTTSNVVQLSKPFASQNASVYTATSSKSGESLVPCSLIPENKDRSHSPHPLTPTSSPFTQNSPTPYLDRSLSDSTTKSVSLTDENWDGKPLPQFRNQCISTSSFGRSPVASLTQHYTRARHNKFSPLSEHLFDDDGDGETWTHSSDENSSENNEEFNDSIGCYSPAGSNHFIAVHNPPKLNVNEALNWATMADDPTIQSWEALADEHFAEALTKNNKVDTPVHGIQLQHLDNKCIQLEMNDRSSVLEQDFPPLQKSHFSIGTSHSPDSSPFIPTYLSSSPTNDASHSSNVSKSSGSVYAPSPIMTRAQRKKQSNALSITKQQKLKKAANRETKALSRLSKSKNSVHTSPLDPDEVQWHICLKDIKQRVVDAKKAATTSSKTVL